MTALEIMAAACAAAEERGLRADGYGETATIQTAAQPGGFHRAGSCCAPDAVPQQTDAPHLSFHPSLTQEQRQDLLERFNERAAIAEFDDGLSRAEAEKEAWRLIETCKTSVQAKIRAPSSGEIP